MFDNRNLRLDLAALALLGLVIFLAVALGTYNAADPIPEPLAPLHLFYHPDPVIFPQNARIHNACGLWGAMAADVLLQGLGFGAYFLVLSLLVLEDRKSVV